MVSVKNIRSLSDFTRNTKAHIRNLKKSGDHEVLTVNGQAELVVMSAAAYQKWVAAMEMEENLNSIRKGIEEAERGEGMPAAELIRRLRSRNKVRRPT